MINQLKNYWIVLFSYILLRYLGRASPSVQTAYRQTRRIPTWNRAVRDCLGRKKPQRLVRRSCRKWIPKKIDPLRIRKINATYMAYENKRTWTMQHEDLSTNIITLFFYFIFFCYKYHHSLLLFSFCYKYYHILLLFCFRYKYYQKKQV